MPTASTSASIAAWPESRQLARSAEPRLAVRMIATTMMVTTKATKVKLMIQYIFGRSWVDKRRATIKQK